MSVQFFTALECVVCRLQEEHRAKTCPVFPVSPPANTRYKPLQPMEVDNIPDIGKGVTRILTDTGSQIAESINKGEDLIDMINGTG